MKAAHIAWIGSLSSLLFSLFWFLGWITEPVLGIGLFFWTILAYFLVTSRQTTAPNSTETRLLKSMALVLAVLYVSRYYFQEQTNTEEQKLVAYELLSPSFDLEEEAFKVLIYPFGIKAPNGKDVGQLLADHLTKADLGAGLQVAYQEVVLPEVFGLDEVKYLQNYHQVDQVIYSDSSCAMTLEETCCYWWTKEQEKPSCFHYQEALQLYQYESLLDLNTPKIKGDLEYLSNWIIASNAFRMGKYAVAKQYWQRIHSKKTNKDKDLLIALGMACKKLADYNSAVDYYTIALPLCTTKQDSLLVIQHLAGIALNQNDPQTAIQLLEPHVPSVDAMLRNLLLSNKVDKDEFGCLSCAIKNNLGIAYFQLEDYEKALELFDIQDWGLDLIGKENFLYAAVNYANWAWTKYYMGAYDNAELQFVLLERAENSIELIKLYYDYLPASTRGMFLNCAIIVQEIESRDYVESLFEQALTGAKEFYGDNHSNLAYYYYHYGHYYYNREAYEQAQEFLHKAAEQLKMATEEQASLTLTVSSLLQKTQVALGEKSSL